MLTKQKKPAKVVKKPSQNLALKKRAMIEALESTLGVVTLAAKKVGINRESHYEWLRKDEKYAEAVEELQNVVLDFSESQLFQRIKSGDTTAIIFHLKMRGKARGYVEKQEVEQHTTHNMEPEMSAMLEKMYKGK